MKYYRGKYVADNSTAIEAYTDDGEPWAVCTVCLADYGMKTPSEDFIFVPTYKLFNFYEQFKKDLIEEVVMPVRFGYGEGVLAKLKPNWKELTEEML